MALRPLSIRVEDSTIAQLDQIASRLGWTRSHLVNFMISTGADATATIVSTGDLRGFLATGLSKQGGVAAGSAAEVVVDERAE